MHKFSPPLRPFDETYPCPIANLRFGGVNIKPNWSLGILVKELPEDGPADSSGTYGVGFCLIESPEGEERGLSLEFMCEQMLDVCALPDRACSTKMLARAINMHDFSAKDLTENIFVAIVSDCAEIFIGFEGWENPESPNPEDPGSLVEEKIVLSMVYGDFAAEVIVPWPDIAPALDLDLPSEEE